MTSPSYPDHGLTPDNVGLAENVSQETINAVVGAVRDLCGWHIWPEREETLSIRSTGDREIFLPTKHVTEVLAIRVGETDVEVSEDEWSYEGIIVLPHAPRPGRRIHVTVRHGYPSAPTVVAIIKALLERGISASQGIKVGGISVNATSGLTPQSSEWRLLDQWKLGPMP